MGNIGLQELLFLCVIALLCIGPKRLPELARALGEAMRAFRQAMAEHRLPDGAADDMDMTPKLPAEDIPRPPIADDTPQP